MGFPLGLPLTVTKGSVSGLDRTIAIEGTQRRKLVQTDTALNPGPWRRTADRTGIRQRRRALSTPETRRRTGSRGP